MFDCDGVDLWIGVMFEDDLWNFVVLYVMGMKMVYVVLLVILVDYIYYYIDDFSVFLL